MGILLETVKLIEKRIQKESHRPWLEVIDEVKAELKINSVLNKSEAK